MRRTLTRLALSGMLLAMTSAPAQPPRGVVPVGLWEGVLHGGRGDEPAAIVIRPRGPFAFAGMVYAQGEEFGPIEDGRVNGDSLTFRATHYPFFGRLEAGTLSLVLVVPHGSTHGLSLTRTSTDTTLLPASVRAAPARAVLPATTRDVAPDSVYMAHAMPADRAPGTLPCLRRGTLLLIGGGPGQADHVARFMQLAGGASARIVVIPTAHIETDDGAAIAEFGENTARNLGIPRVQVLHTFSRREADTEEFVNSLRMATGVWIDGGEASYLLNAYLGTRTERELLALLDRGGVIAGTSAGALIWGSRSMVFRAHPGTKSYALPSSEDLLVGQPHEPIIGALEDVLIVPHFTEFKMQPMLAKMLAAYPMLLAFGIDEATALEVHGEVCKVLGRSHVSVFRGNAGTPLVVLQDGARFDLRRLAVL